jgi:ubiquinone/menaquinone biosynthesis C-methylase UbiE
MGEAYIHGYHAEEQERLRAQAAFLENKIFEHVDLSGINKLLEPGCGVGAQSRVLLRRFPKLSLTGVDISSAQIEQAVQFVQPLFPRRCRFLQADASATGLLAESFDGAFFCWVLEHVPDPVAILRETWRLLEPGGKVFLTEVFNASLYVFPHNPALETYWAEYNRLQAELGGDPHVGAKLGFLLREAGFEQIEVVPRIYHWDARQPDERRLMIDYWSRLLLSGADQLLATKRVTPELMEAALSGLEMAARDPRGVFYYSFVQATATRA